MEELQLAKKAQLYENNLVRILHENDFRLLTRSLRPVRVKAGDILYEPGDIVNYTYFPTGPALVSFIVLLDESRTVEVATIGREGAVGGIVSQGKLPAFCRAQVQFPGTLLRIETAQLEKVKNESPTMQYFFSRYADSLLSQVFQAVACNAMHTIEQRTAKLLLASVDRTGDMVVPLTQEQLASMMGVGRSYVARVISSLKEQNVLITTRARVKIADLSKLRSVACGCDHVVHEHSKSVLTGAYAEQAS